MHEVSDEERLALMMMKLDQDVGSIFRQTAFYNFETDVHALFREKGYLTKEEIALLFKKHMKSYMGNVAEGSENWWNPTCPGPWFG